MRKVLLSPHNDDAVLFAAFTLLKHRPTVVTVFDSYVQPERMAASGKALEAKRCSCENRQAEDAAAFGILGIDDWASCGFRDTENEIPTDRIAERIYSAAQLVHISEAELWAPMYERGGHAQHNAVAIAADNFAKAGAIVNRYTTYTRDKGRTRLIEVIPEPAWVLKKLRAMACYDSQITIAELGCWPWFMELREYIPG